MHSSPLNNENELLSQIAEGDEYAFGIIYKHYVVEVNSFLIKYLKSTQLAEDISQEIFVKIWENRSRLAQVDSFKAYLFVTARNHSLNVLKSTSHSIPIMSELINKYEQLRNNTEVEILVKEYTLFLEKAIASLPPRSREVFRMCREKGKSYNEVAEYLGMSRNSVKSHMIYSMKRLKAEVEKELGISFALFLLIIGRH